MRLRFVSNVLLCSYLLVLDSPIIQAKTIIVRKEVCPTVAKWANISWAETMQKEPVEVMQNVFGWGDQFFYMVLCRPSCEGKPCQGVLGYPSQCETKFSYVQALTYNGASKSIEWNYIRVPGGCSCVRLIPEDVELE